jgi:hypothetical protein
VTGAVSDGWELFIRATTTAEATASYYNAGYNKDDGFAALNLYVDGAYVSTPGQSATSSS